MAVETRHPRAEQIPEFITLQQKQSIIFPSLEPHPDVTPDQVTQALSSLSFDKLDSLNTFLKMFSAVPLQTLRDFKRKNDENPLKDIYTLMEKRTGQLKNETLTFWRQVEPLYNPKKEIGITTEEKQLFAEACIASLAIDSDENIRNAALAVLYRVEPDLLPSKKTTLGTKGRKQVFSDTLLDRVFSLVPPKRFAKLALGTAVLLDLPACDSLIPARKISDTPERPAISTPIETNPIPGSLTKKPTLLPTETRIPLTKTVTPPPTKTEIPTVIPTETELAASWKDQFFIPIEKEQELRDKGAIILRDLPVEQWKDLKITGPGQAYAMCNLTGMKNIIPKTSYLTQIKIDRMHYGEAVCFVRSSTEQQIRDGYKKVDTLANSERIQHLTNDFMRLSKAMYSQIPEGVYYLDTYLALMLWYDPENIDHLNWLLLGVSDEDYSLTTYIKTIPIH